MKSFWSWFLSLKPGNFLRQVLVVIVSVTLTLGVGRCVDAQKRKSHIEVSLSLVRDELVANLQDTKGMYEQMQEANWGCTMLDRHRDALSGVQPDTLETWVEQALPILLVSAPSKYALEVLKDAAVYDELSNALLIYLCQVYGWNDSYMRECESIFAETKTIYAQVNTIGSSHAPRKSNPTIHDLFQLMQAVPQFRDRVNRTTDFGVEFGADVVMTLQRSIAVLDSLIKNDGYKEFKISPATDYIGAM